MKETIIVIIGVTLFYVGLFFASKVIERHACFNKTESFEERKYYFFGGCMVKHKGKWLPLDNIRGFDDKG